MADDHETFEEASAGASNTYPMQCSALRKNGHVIIKGKPCKIVEMSTSKTGKHGHAKVNLVGIDIFTGKKYEDICPSTHNMDVPNVKRTEMTLVDITPDGYVTLMDESGETREDLKLPEGNDDIRIKFESLSEDQSLMVTVLKAMDQEMLTSAKAGK
ncbi:eukaryotic translation initiation factor 5A-1-like [Watersipora subatra]|uniref:eukaryotic translation initiation factor 5A-1-like n=1 Tax=Watersipora subatra TaxID=2589382 RepID=UPI00355B9E63